MQEIDFENSTGLWRYKRVNSFNSIVEYILDPKNNFFDKLKKGNKDLPDELGKVCSKPNEKSFCSKVCKNLGDFLYPNKDNYYINDRYIRALLLFYRDYYNVTKISYNKQSNINNLTYQDLWDALEEIRKAANNQHHGNLKRRELDTIIWYCYRSFDVDY